MTTNLLRFFLGMTNFFYLHVPSNLYVKARRRKLFLCCNDKVILMDIFLQLIVLKEKIPYKLRGFFFPRQLILMKSGKKRF